jgi:hypothetical protein
MAFPRNSQQASQQSSVIIPLQPHAKKHIKRQSKLENSGFRLGNEKTSFTAAFQTLAKTPNEF